MSKSSFDTIIHIERKERIAECLPHLHPDELVEKLIPGKVFRSSIDKDLLYFGSYPFYNCFINAFANHYPLRFSPDIIYLAILQGFARHVDANAEKLRKKFVNFQGRKLLTVLRIAPSVESLTTEDFNSIFSEFTTQIGQNIGQELVDKLSPDFTTTTKIEYTTCLLTLMTALKKYFKYKLAVAGCGVPYVVLEGTVDDWIKLKEKVMLLKEYDLEWWIERLEPILDEFIAAKKGNLHIPFWRKMIRIRYGDDEDAYAEDVYDGWFINFFPYNKDGERSYFFPIPIEQEMPKELLNCPFEIEFLSDTEHKKYDLNIISGFVGASQDPATLELKPEIGWAITNPDTAVVDTQIKELSYSDEEKLFNQCQEDVNNFIESAFKAVDTTSKGYITKEQYDDFSNKMKEQYPDFTNYSQWIEFMEHFEGVPGQLSLNEIKGNSAWIKSALIEDKIDKMGEYPH